MKPIIFLRIFLGLVFVSAGTYRIFHWQDAILELSRLNLCSPYLAIFIIVLEIIGGILLIFNIKTKRISLAFIIFILVALIGAFLADGKNIISNLGELFVLNPTPTDIFLHLIYFIILICLLTY